MIYKDWENSRQSACLETYNMAWWDEGTVEPGFWNCERQTCIESSILRTVMILRDSEAPRWCYGKGFQQIGTPGLVSFLLLTSCLHSHQLKQLQSRRQGILLMQFIEVNHLLIKLGTIYKIGAEIRMESRLCKWRGPAFGSIWIWVTLHITLGKLFSYHKLISLYMKRGWWYHPRELLQEWNE